MADVKDLTSKAIEKAGEAAPEDIYLIEDVDGPKYFEIGRAA